MAFISLTVFQFLTTKIMHKIYVLPFYSHNKEQRELKQKWNDDIGTRLFTLLEGRRRGTLHYFPFLQHPSSGILGSLNPQVHFEDTHRLFPDH